MSTAADIIQHKVNITECLDALKKANIGYEVAGNPDCAITGYSGIYEYVPSTITWARSAAILKNVSTGIIQAIVTPRDVEKQETFIAQIKADDPQYAFFTILEAFWGEKHKPEIHPTAIIPEGAVIGENVSIGAYSVISPNTVIGNNCRIGANVAIKGKVSIGNDCVIQSGVTIGEDGFAFISRAPVKRVPHFGGVAIGNNVTIHSNTTIYRGTLMNTVISDNVSIDGLCHIAHNSKIHPNTAILPLTVIMGSVEIGKNCWISSSMIRDQRKVGDNSIVGMGAVVVKDVPSNVTVIGNPAQIMRRNDDLKGG